MGLQLEKQELIFVSSHHTALRGDALTMNIFFPTNYDTAFRSPAATEGNFSFPAPSRDKNIS